METATENKHTSRAVLVSAPMEEILAQYQAKVSRGLFIGHTTRTYVSAVRQYLAWLDGSTTDGDPLNDPRARDWAIRDYKTYLITVRKAAPSTVNKAMAAVGDFYAQRGLKVHDEDKVRRLAIPDRGPKHLDSREFTRFTRAAEMMSPRDRAICLTPLYAGARVAEVALLDVGDVIMSARKGQLHLVGKGEKPRNVPICAELRDVLGNWLEVRTGTDDALFTSRYGTRMTTQAIGDVIAKCGDAAGLEVTPHVLRHTFAKQLTDRGVPVQTVQKLLGHARVETTLIYTSSTEEDMERAVSMLPVDR